MQSYLNLLEDVLNNGESHDDRTGVGTRSVFGRQWRHDMRDGFPLLTTKKIPLRWVAEELFWFLSGSTNEKILNAAGVTIWREWATKEQCSKFERMEGDLGPVYGSLWRNFGESYDRTVEPACSRNEGVDQIKNLMCELVNNPNSRRLIVTGWHPYHQSQVALPPCHTLWQIKSHRDGSLSLHLYARSIDSFLGLPFNIASYALLLTLIARAVERPVRDLIISFGDLHIYNNHVQQVETQLSRSPRPLPRLVVRQPEGDTPMDMLLNFRWEHLTLTDYNPHPKIEAPVAI